MTSDPRLTPLKCVAPASPEDERAAKLLAHAGRAPETTPQDLERIWTGLAPKLGVGLALGVPRITGFRVFLAALAVGLTVTGLSILRSSGPRPPAPVVELPAPAAHVPVPVPVPEPVPAPTPTPTQLVAAPRTPAAPRLARPTAPAPAAAPTVEPPESDLAIQTRILGRALEQLRGRHSPAEALASLDELEQRFPTGPFAEEARLTRVEALLAQGRKADALSLLEGLDVSRSPRGVDLGVLRAELLASAGRCPTAIAAFSVLLAKSPPQAVAERALFGRAACLATSGDRRGATADYLLYLEQFPEGRFAERASQALADLAL